MQEKREKKRGLKIGQNRSFSLYNFSSRRNRKGLSTIVITLIIILISLVAVGIIWVVVRNVIQSGTEGIALGQFTLGADIINVNVDNSSNNVSLSVKRSSGEGEITGIKFIFSDETDSEIITEKISMNKLEEKRFTFHLTKLAVSKLISISIVPVLASSSGKETLGSVLSKYNVQEGTTTSGGGGSCVANCTGKVCGNDGCGGSCGSCGTGYSCVGGSCVQQLGWQYDWNTRTDRHGKPAGTFDQTPFPINQTTTEYSIMNDEFPNGKTFYLGTKYYVDGLTGINSGNCQSFTSPCLTIQYALIQAGTGNKAIIVRGAHDGFNGIYYESDVRPRRGISDTNRFIITGYGQERPIIDSANSPSWQYTVYANDSYSTLQRLKVQNNLNKVCIMSTKSFTNIIDIELYNCTATYNHTDLTALGDGLLHSFATNHDWIYHSTAHRTYGHCYKIPDNASNAIIEWSKAYECGWWPGMPSTDTVFWGNHAIGIDFSDHTGYSGDNNIARYNIVYDTLFYPLNLNCNKNFSVHHNEFYNGQRCVDIMTDTLNSCYLHGAGYFTVILLEENKQESSGSFHSNIVRNSRGVMTAYNEKWGLLEVFGSGKGGDIYVYNNLFYNDYNSNQSIWLHNGITNNSVYLYSNSFYTNNTVTIIDDDSTGIVELKNNIFYQAGKGSIIQGTQTHEYNLYYYPSGSRGFTTLGTGEIDGNPQWIALPSGPYNVNEAALSLNSPAINNGTSLPSSFATDILGVSRPQGSAWDIGTYEYVA